MKRSSATSIASIIPVPRTKPPKPVAPLEFHNATTLSDEVLYKEFLLGMRGWRVGRVVTRVRYSRGADFSGTCFYADRRLFINLGRHVRYPYLMATNLARAKTVGRRWYKPTCRIELRDGYELVLFIFMHELYHLLVKLARRNTRRKESMCDRFAARYLVDRFGSPIVDERGREVPREAWDFQDLDGFVAAVRDDAGKRTTAWRGVVTSSGKQLLLFDA